MSFRFVHVRLFKVTLFFISIVCKGAYIHINLCSYKCVFNNTYITFSVCQDFILL